MPVNSPSCESSCRSFAVPIIEDVKAKVGSTTSSPLNSVFRADVARAMPKFEGVDRQIILVRAQSLQDRSRDDASESALVRRGILPAAEIGFFDFGPRSRMLPRSATNA
jgi:hypothetical protein